MVLTKTSTLFLLLGEQSASDKNTFIPPLHSQAESNLVYRLMQGKNLRKKRVEPPGSPSSATGNNQSVGHQRDSEKQLFLYKGSKKTGPAGARSSHPVKGMALGGDLA